MNNIDVTTYTNKTAAKTSENVLNKNSVFVSSWAGDQSEWGASTGIYVG